MTDVKAFIQSGILEMYVLGTTSPDETALVADMAARYSEVRDEIEAIGIALEEYGKAHAIEPDPTLRVFIMATIEYMERMKRGEQPTFPPMLHKGSKPADYAQWLGREDLQLHEPLEDAYAHIIGNTPEAMTAIVWLKYGALPETHAHEHERFLIIEGTCDITIDQKVHSLKPGDFLEIPLYASHHVQVTSECPCKLVLQRAAA